MEPDHLRFILEELRFSAALPSSVLDQLAAESLIQQFSAGAVIFREGSINNNLYFVRSGRIALEMGVPGSGATRILTLGPGEMAGWSSLLDQGKMTASAVAVEATEVIVAPADKLREVCEANHDFGYYLMRQMAGALSMRLVATRLQLLDLFGAAPTSISAKKTEGQG